MLCEKIMIKFITLILSVLISTATMAETQNERLEQALKLVKSDRSEEALPILKPLANEGNPGAQIALGYYYLLEKKNEKESLKWFHSAAETGDALAQASIGLVLTDIISTPEHDFEGVEWLIKAAKQGNKVAAIQLSNFYSKGVKGLPKNQEKSQYWLKQSQHE